MVNESMGAGTRSLLTGGTRLGGTPEGPSALVSLRDVTEMAQLREHLNTLALTDELTGLYNRRGWSVLAQQQLLLAKRTSVPVMLLYADLDGLKGINDVFGHSVGDEAIVAFACALRSTFRESDLVARMGGDEFAVLPIDANRDSEQVLKSRLKRKLIDWSKSSERRYELAATVGIFYLRPESGKTLDDALCQADELMNEQKRGKKSSRRGR